MNQLIDKWLQGKRSYVYGVILYKRFGVDEVLKKLFEGGKTNYTETKLLECLQQIAADGQPQSIEGESPLQGVGGWPEEKTDKILKALRAQWMPLYTEMNYKRHQLDTYLFQKSDAALRKRGKLAFEILELEQQCMAIWYRRDFYKKFGKLPNDIEKPDPVVNPKMFGIRYKNVQGYIRRYKHLLKKEPDNENYIAIKKKYEDELVQLKKQMQ